MKSKKHHFNSNLNIKWKLDLDRPVIVVNMEERNWERVDEEDMNFNFFWASVKAIKHIFNPKHAIRLQNNQIVNHFPNHYELTRKDLMAKNIKRFRPISKTITLVNGEKMEMINTFIPPTFILPIEYTIFMEEFTRNQDKRWIFKPAAKSQGKGISLVTKFAQAKNIPIQISKDSKFEAQNYIISRYIDNPFLIDNKKFDLRTFVLVTNYRPLKVWRCTEGIARICFEDYINLKENYQQDPNKELFSHLTNVSFQKYSNKYNEIHGGKWPLSSLFDLLERNIGKEKVQILKRKMDQIYLSSLKAVQNVILNDKHCFELYGFDILIDEDLTPWLIEVNASPSMIGTTKHDFAFKKLLINDLLNIILPPNWEEEKSLNITSMSKEKKVGLFELIYNEAKDPLNVKMHRPKTSIKKALSNKYYY